VLIFTKLSVDSARASSLFVIFRKGKQEKESNNGNIMRPNVRAADDGFPMREALFAVRQTN